jgi:hypothetical protein
MGSGRSDSLEVAVRRALGIGYRMVPSVKVFGLEMWCCDRVFMGWVGGGGGGLAVVLEIFGEVVLEISGGFGLEFSGCVVEGHRVKRMGNWVV